VKLGEWSKIVPIEKSTHTFFNIKQEVNNDLAKTESEFFLTDENGVVYLDNLNVVKALFPFKNVRINNYIPKLLILVK